MNMKEKLELLSLADKFTVTESKDYFRITTNNTDEDYKPIMAEIDKATNEISYYMFDIGNNSCDMEEINIEELKDLMNFCKLLKGDVKK